MVHKERLQEQIAVNIETAIRSTVSSFGGVVNLVTKKPFGTTATEISYTGGSFLD